MRIISNNHTWMSIMPTKEELEHKVALLNKLLELEHARLMSERDRANDWQADSERKEKTIEALKLQPEKTQSDNPDWQIITKHFNDLLDEEDIPNKHVKHGGKKRIRREANNRATLENIDIREYSDDDLVIKLKFPQKPMSRNFARKPQLR